MQAKKFLTLFVLAGLMTLVRPKRDPETGPASRPLRAPPDADGAAYGSSESSGTSSVSASLHVRSAWLLFRANWRAILWNVYENINKNRLLAVAAGVVFYG